MWLYGWDPIKVRYHSLNFCVRSRCHSGSGIIMTSVCHMILQDHVMKGLCDFMSGTPHDKSTLWQVWWPQSLRLWRIIFPVAEEDFKRSCFNLPLLLSIKDIAWKHTKYHIDNSDPGHRHLKQQLKKNLKTTFASSPKNAVRKNEENNCNCKASFRYTQTQLIYTSWK